MNKYDKQIIIKLDEAVFGKIKVMAEANTLSLGTTVRLLVMKALSGQLGEMLSAFNSGPDAPPAERAPKRVGKRVPKESLSPRYV